MQATNYCGQLNRAMKIRAQRWVVRAIYADTRLNVEYVYRTERGAQAQLAHLRRMIDSDATRSLGNETPMIATSISEVNA